MRNFDFYDDRAIYRDARRKLEVTLDQSAMPIIWDATWNRWRHLLGAKVELQGTFVQTGKYRRRNGQWSLSKWETALPSRIHVKVPANIAEQIETARKSYHRFGEFSDALGQIRARIEREPMEREQLRSLCWDLGIPGDFDVAQINWKPDYDPFFYQQLCRRARRLYLFRDEYIFDLPRDGSPSRHRNWVTRRTCFPSPRASKPSSLLTSPPRRRLSGRIVPTWRTGWDS